MKKYSVILLSILLLAFFLRVFHFDNRVYILGDNARDVLVAREALKENVIPLFASFSSAGPFVFGPQYYWLLMAVYFFGFNSWNIFYYFLIFQSLIFVVVMMLIGKELVSRKFALITGLIVAFSGRQIARSMAMTQHSVVALLSALAVYFFILLIKRKKIGFAFLCGFFVSNAFLVHYQALGLMIFAPLILFLSGGFKKKAITLIIFLVGVIIPAIPFLIWDQKMQFANIRNFLDFFLIGQYRFYFANRWLTHIFDFWPKMIADLFSGNTLLGGIILYGSVLFFMILAIRKKVSKPLALIFVCFVFFFLYFRFYRGEKLEGYFIYLHPILFIFISLFFYLNNKYLTFAFLILSLFTARLALVNEYSRPIIQYQEFKKIENKILKAGRGTKFIVFDGVGADGSSHTWDMSEAFALFLDVNHAYDSKKGRPLVFCTYACPSDNYVEIKDEMLTFYKYRLLILDKKGTEKLVDRSPKAVMNEILFWWQKKPLKSTFDLKKYIMERIP